MGCDLSRGRVLRNIAMSLLGVRACITGCVLGSSLSVGGLSSSLSALNSTKVLIFFSFVGLDNFAVVSINCCHGLAFISLGDLSSVRSVFRFGIAFLLDMSTAVVCVEFSVVLVTLILIT